MPVRHDDTGRGLVDRLPAWLNPWWRDQYQIAVPISVDQIWARLRATGRVMTTLSADGNELIVIKRGRYLGGYVQTVAKLTSTESGTEVNVTFSRPAPTAWLMAAFAILGVVLPVGEALPVVLRNGLAGLWRPSSLVLLIGPLGIYFVMALNHSSAQSDVKELKAFIGSALTRPPLWLWRSL